MSDMFDLSDRLKNLPPYLFVEIDKAKRKLREEEKDVIDLGIGDPDTPTLPYIIDAMKEAVEDPRNHSYALDAGLVELRKTVANWYDTRFGVSGLGTDEVLPLIGSKDGIGHICLAFANPGDYILVPEPGYPGYQSSAILAGATPYYMPLLEENGYLPDLAAIPADILAKTKLMFLNYPNNPTGAIAGEDFYKDVVKFAKANDIIVCHDAAYSEIAFDGYVPMSFLEVEGAKDVGVEFHSLSKTYNMTGWRMGFAVGNSKVLTGLAKVKSNVDSGVFQAIQVTAIEAMTGDQTYQKDLVNLYKDRRDAVVAAMNEIGIEVDAPKAAFYIWFKVPGGLSSADFCMKLLNECAVVVTPGNGFGVDGEGYARISLTVEKDRLLQGIERIKTIL